jgi:hypothetical protein
MTIKNVDNHAPNYYVILHGTGCVIGANYTQRPASIKTKSK